MSTIAVTDIVHDYYHCSCFRTSMLESIPPEVLGLVAYHLSIESLQPPTNILQASKQLHDTLSPRSNPNLYARIFKATFDTSAATRRCTSDLTARKLTDELELRTRALGRLKRRVRNGNVGGVEDRDLWVIYILLIEHGTYFAAYISEAKGLMG
jgi:hypothetical protein